MKLDILTDNELFRLAAHQEDFNEHIDKEWRKRYQLSFPYQIGKNDSKIYNVLLDVELGYEECDKMIVEQAKLFSEKGESFNG